MIDPRTTGLIYSESEASFSTHLVLLVRRGRMCWNPCWMWSCRGCRRWRRERARSGHWTRLWECWAAAPRTTTASSPSVWTSDPRWAASRTRSSWTWATAACTRTPPSRSGCVKTWATDRWTFSCQCCLLSQTWWRRSRSWWLRTSGCKLWAKQPKHSSVMKNKRMCVNKTTRNQLLVDRLHCLSKRLFLFHSSERFSPFLQNSNCAKRYSPTWGDRFLNSPSCSIHSDVPSIINSLRWLAGSLYCSSVQAAHFWTSVTVQA